MDSAMPFAPNENRERPGAPVLSRCSMLSTSPFIFNAALAPEFHLSLTTSAKGRPPAPPLPQFKQIKPIQTVSRFARRHRFGAIKYPRFTRARLAMGRDNWFHTITVRYRPRRQPRGQVPRQQPGLLSGS